MPPITITEDLKFFGIGSMHQDYNLLSQRSPMLFGLYTSTSSVRNVDGHIIAPQYVTTAPSGVSKIPVGSLVKYVNIAHYMLICKYMNKSMSENVQAVPWLSATFNFAFIVWEALRRIMYEFVEEEYLYVVLIDGQHSMLEGRCCTAIQKLHALGGAPGTEEWNFADVSQHVLIHGYIPAEAVVGIAPWKKLRRRLPVEYFNYDFMVLTNKGMSAFRNYSWNVASELVARLNQQELTIAAVVLAACIMKERLSFGLGDPERTIKTVCEVVSALGFWVVRRQGPKPELYGSSRPGAIRQHIARIMAKHEDFGSWSELVRLQLVMEQVSVRYGAYKRIVMEKKTRSVAKNKLMRGLEHAMKEVQ